MRRCWCNTNLPGVSICPEISKPFPTMLKFFPSQNYRKCQKYWFLHLFYFNKSRQICLYLGSLFSQKLTCQIIKWNILKNCLPLTFKFENIRIKGWIFIMKNNFLWCFKKCLISLRYNGWAKPNFLLNTNGETLVTELFSKYQFNPILHGGIKSIPPGQLLHANH